MSPVVLGFLGQGFLIRFLHYSVYLRGLDVSEVRFGT